MKISDMIADGKMILNVWRYFVYGLSILGYQQCKEDVSAVTAMGFTVENKHLVKWLYLSKWSTTLVQDVFYRMKMKSWWAKYTDQ